MNLDFGPATDYNNSNMYNADLDFLNGQGLSIDNMDTDNMTWNLDQTRMRNTIAAGSNLRPAHSGGKLSRERIGGKVTWKVTQDLVANS